MGIKPILKKKVIKPKLQLLEQEISGTTKEGIKKEAGLYCFPLATKQWCECRPEVKGNMRDHPNVNQLLCLAKLESLKAHFIDQELSQADRLLRLNDVAIRKMQILLANETLLMLGDNSDG